VGHKLLVGAVVLDDLPDGSDRSFYDTFGATRFEGDRRDFDLQLGRGFASVQPVWLTLGVG
jgi:hypothetical protein